MSIVFRCPACGRDLEATEDAYNVEGSCRFCGAKVISPNGPDASATLVPLAPHNAQFAHADIIRPTGRIKPFDIVSEAWRVYSANSGLLIVTMLLANLAQYIVGQVVGHLGWGSLSRPTLLVDGFATILLAPLATGPWYVCARAASGRAAQFRHMFQGFRHAGPLMTATLLVGIPWIMVYASVPLPPTTHSGEPSYTAMSGWWAMEWPRLAVVVLLIALIMIPVSLVMMEVIDRGCGVVEAVNASLEATRGHYAALLATRVLLMLIGLSGVVLCCFGIILTAPMAIAGDVVIYRHLRGLQGTPDA
ncbi:MAG TPA: hypothetical protein VGM51_03075 [Armatimonadota bacterium]|jgi:hypothetical protein